MFACGRAARARGLTLRRRTCGGPLGRIRPEMLEYPADRERVPDLRDRVEAPAAPRTQKRVGTVDAVDQPGPSRACGRRAHGRCVVDAERRCCHGGGSQLERRSRDDLSAQLGGRSEDPGVPQLVLRRRRDEGGDPAQEGQRLEQNGGRVPLSAGRCEHDAAIRRRGELALGKWGSGTVASQPLPAGLVARGDRDARVHREASDLPRAPPSGAFPGTASPLVPIDQGESGAVGEHVREPARERISLLVIAFVAGGVPTAAKGGPPPPCVARRTTGRPPSPRR